MNTSKKFLLSFVFLTIFILAACSNNSNQPNKSESNNQDQLKVVTSFTIIADLAREIGGDDVTIHNLVPTGTDPHEYEPLPEDIKKATDADILFYNGLNLEGGDHGWFNKMVEAVKQKDENIFSLTERVEPMYIGGHDGIPEEINPHAFIDPAVGIKMAEDMRDAFMKRDPDRKANYEERATSYIAKLKELDQQFGEKINSLPENKRILVTSERAFQYLADHYGLKEAYLWEIDTEENGSPAQIKSLIEFIQNNEVPVVFIESNVDPRPMETVAQETGVPIASAPIYSDEIGMPGEEVDTYVKYLQYNMDLITTELSK